MFYQKYKKFIYFFLFFAITAWPFLNFYASKTNYQLIYFKDFLYLFLLFFGGQVLKAGSDKSQLDLLRADRLRRNRIRVVRLLDTRARDRHFLDRTGTLRGSRTGV